MSLDLVLREDEKAVFKLRELYNKYGYAPYKMSKFEEYDLYALNKEFLVSDNVITFTDTDGKLMALKPDVTLSIIKNTKIGQGVQKVYYDENVYRVSKGTKSFKEIRQAGLECMGDIDDYSVSEVIALALKSLAIISDDFYLDVSSLDLIDSIFNQVGLDEISKKQMLTYLAQKNANGVQTVCEEQGLSARQTELLVALVKTYGNVNKVASALKAFDLDNNALCALDKLIVVIESLSSLGFEDKINVDFSVVNDLNYYNGFVFKGFISGIPTGILSGGQYDKLMQKMNKKTKAIGFAVYLDELSKLKLNDNEYDVDVAIEYKNASLKEVNALVEKCVKEGKSVYVGKKIDGACKYASLVKLGE